jgi:hypothetical protein
MFLVNGHSIPGFSGSPVFSFETSSLSAIRYERMNDDRLDIQLWLSGHCLIGINCGHSHRKVKLSSILDSPEGEKPFTHTLDLETGLAMVLPAWKIEETMGHAVTIIDGKGIDYQSALVTDTG